MGIEEGLLAEAIPGQEELLRLFIPDDKGKHSPKSFHAALAKLLVEMDNNLRVGLCSENMAFLLQLLPQALVIVDFAVVDNPDGLVLVTERLMPTGQINDAEAAVAKTDPTIEVKALIVRATMGDHLQHRAQLFLPHTSLAIFSANSAHQTLTAVTEYL
jgi:hypothetical protein